MSSSVHRPTERVLSVLEYVASRNMEWISLASISEAVNIPKGTLHPIIQTLVSKNYLSSNKNDAQYKLGLQAFTLGMQYLQSSSNFDDIILFAMKKVVNTCNETCHYGKLSGGNVVYIYKIDSTEPIRMFSAPGKRSSAYATALGKAILSGLSDDEIRALYPDGLYAITENTITDMDALLTQIDSVRKSGLSWESEENENLIKCFAVPIKIDGRVASAISVTIPTFRSSTEKDERIISLLYEARSYIESFERLG